MSSPAPRSPVSTMPEETLRNAVAAIAAHGDKQAFALLFRHFAPKLKAYCIRQGANPETAEELMQEAMVQVWRKAATFDPSKAAVSTWLFTIVRNKRIDMIRREVRPELKAEDFEVFVQPEQGADDRVGALIEADRIAVALKTLTADQRLVLEKAFYEDKSHSAIAIEIGLPLGTVKSRIRLALSRLKVMIADDHGYPNNA
jgi:RNA polymerase sigma-70 factor, ECF subfamily